MWKLLNLKCDRRTARNIGILPIVLVIRVPTVLVFWLVEWLHDNLEYWIDKMPGWDSN